MKWHYYNSISHTDVPSNLTVRYASLVWLKVFWKHNIFIVKCTLIIFLGVLHCKIFFVWLWFLLHGIEIKAEAKSEKETWPNYAIQPFARHIFRSISPMQQLATKDWHVFSLTLYEHLTIYLSFSMQSNQHKLRKFDDPWHQSTNCCTRF